MKPSPKTIQIFLPGGDPRGIRMAEMTTRIVQLIEVPRSLLQDFFQMSESGQVAVYFLFGADDGGAPKVYIGQTGDLRSRLATHNKQKDFWERALVLVSRTNSITQTHALFLEWHCIQTARKASRYADENGNSGSKPHTPAPLEADCLEIFDTANILVSTLGYPLFEPLVKPAGSSADSEIFYCKASDSNGRGIYTEEGFVVLKGSRGRATVVPSMAGQSGEKARERLLADGVLRREGDAIIFERDQRFGSPSMAAIVLTGRNSNGWTEWKNQEGKTLDEVKRQGLSA